MCLAPMIRSCATIRQPSQTGLTAGRMVTSANRSGSVRSGLLFEHPRLNSEDDTLSPGRLREVLGLVRIVQRRLQDHSRLCTIFSIVDLTYSRWLPSAGSSPGSKLSLKRAR